jgi:hypothetical protein
MNKLFWTWVLVSGCHWSWATSGGHGGGHSSGGHGASAHASGAHLTEHLGGGYRGSGRYAQPQEPLPPSYYSAYSDSLRQQAQPHAEVAPLWGERDSTQTSSTWPLLTPPLSDTLWSNGYVQAGGYALGLLLLYALRRVSQRAPAGK